MVSLWRNGELLSSGYTSVSHAKNRAKYNAHDGAADYEIRVDGEPVAFAYLGEHRARWITDARGIEVARQEAGT